MKGLGKVTLGMEIANILVAFFLILYWKDIMTMISKLEMTCKLEKTFDFCKFQYLIEENPLKYYEQKFISGAKPEEKSVQAIEFCDKSKIK